MSADLLSTFKARYAFPLDDFQLRAIAAIDAGQSVIVSAPTGAGKTLVAEFAIHRVLHRGRRIAYTTPLKALSNQKYADFMPSVRRRQRRDPHRRRQGQPARARARDDHGDPAQHVLTAAASTGLETVVLDECHYMGDEGRGTVWEEIIVNCPRERRAGRRCRRPSPTSTRSPTGSRSCTVRSWPSSTRTGRCRSSYVVADLSGEIHAGRPCVAARCARVGRRARGAPTTAGAGTRAASSIRRC